VPHSHKQFGYRLGFSVIDNRKPSNAGGMIRETEVAAPQRAYLGGFQEGICERSKENLENMSGFFLESQKDNPERVAWATSTRGAQMQFLLCTPMNKIKHTQLKPSNPLVSSGGQGPRPRTHKS